MKLDKYALFKQGIYAEQMTSRRRLISIANRLRPVTTRFDLIRIGGKNDGGYLVPDDLDGIAACFSPGVDVNASFEIDLLKKRGINSHLADYSVNGPPMGFEPKSFTKKHLGPVDDRYFMTLDKWVREKSDHDSNGELLLQMDIEGAEYISLLATSEEVLKTFRIILVEIHDIEAWGQPNFFRIVETFFGKLLRHFHVVHNHPNNCCGLVNLGGFIFPRVFELTLLRKDRATADGTYSPLPHPLDSPNLPDRDDISFPLNWDFA